MNNQIKKAVPVVLSVLGSAGVVGTAILAIKNSKKWYQENLSKDATKQDIAKHFVKCYYPTMIVGGLSIASVVTGTIISKKTEASLSGAIVLLERGYNKYQNQVKKSLGLDTHNNLLTEMAKSDIEEKKVQVPTDDRKLFWNKYIGSFYAKQADVNRAILNMNMRLNVSIISEHLGFDQIGHCTLGQFVEDAHAELLEPKIFNQWKDFGWTNEYLFDTMEDTWIYDYYNDDSSKEGKAITIIEFKTAEPIYVPNGWDHKKYALEKSEKWHGTYINDIQCDEVGNCDEYDLQHIACGGDICEK